MKTMITFLMLIVCSITFAQDKIYVHTATAANSSGHITYIDHPDLNDNPDANIVYKHVWNPNGGTGVYNDNIDGLWYNGSQWTIFNEDTTIPMVEGASFMVYIGSNPDNFITHIASVANEHPAGNLYTVIDDPDFNDSIGPYAIMSNYWNPHSIYNPNNYGFWYDETIGHRVIYNEGLEPIPTDAAFKILKETSGSITRFTHEADATNVNLNWTVIDNPALNGNPDATFVFQHYWGVNGPQSEVLLNEVVSAWYTGSNWALYTEDLSDMPEGVAFDIIVTEQEVLGLNDNEILASNVTMYPNPASNEVSITSEHIIDNIVLYNVLGQEVFQSDYSSNTALIDLSTLATGSYFVRVQIGASFKTLKLFKD